jgi:hypothetical protein
MGPHVSSEGLHYRAAPRVAPGPNTYATVLPTRPAPTSYVGTKVRWALESPEALVEARTTAHNRPPRGPVVPLRSPAAPPLPPQQEWALGPRAPRGAAEDPAWFWGATLGERVDPRS